MALTSLTIFVTHNVAAKIKNFEYVWSNGEPAFTPALISDLEDFLFSSDWSVSEEIAIYRRHGYSARFEITAI